MWKRAQLKRLGKRALWRNYLAAVAVCFLLAFIGAENGESLSIVHRSDEAPTNYSMVKDEITQRYELRLEGEHINLLDRVAETLFNAATASHNWVFRFLAGGLFLLSAVLMLAFQFAVCAPLMVSSRRFFLRNRTEKASLLELTGVFHRDQYFRVVAVMFLRWLYTALWTLLLVVPGIIKAFEYYMIPYILADNPYLSRSEVFRLSKALMRGQKWRTFVLGLSFILWDMLGSVTLGLAGIFFVNPYRTATMTELYATLKGQALADGTVSRRQLPSDEMRGEPI